MDIDRTADTPRFAFEILALVMQRVHEWYGAWQYKIIELIPIQAIVASIDRECNALMHSIEHRCPTLAQQQSTVDPHAIRLMLLLDSLALLLRCIAQPNSGATIQGLLPNRLLRIAYDSHRSGSVWLGRAHASLLALIVEHPTIVQFNSTAELLVDIVNSTADMRPPMRSGIDDIEYDMHQKQYNQALAHVAMILQRLCATDQAQWLLALQSVFHILRLPPSIDVQQQPEQPEQQPQQPQQHTSSVLEPSLAVATVFQHTPEPLIALAASHVTDPSVAGSTDAEIVLAIARVMQLPQTHMLALWSCALLNGLAIHQRYLPACLLYNSTQHQCIY
jgi:hypothetical protein